MLALIDTGADQTQIPIWDARALGLDQIDVMDITGADGSTRPKPVYPVDLEFEGIRFLAASVVADEYPLALVGRDLLNELNTSLQGPARIFTTARP